VGWNHGAISNCYSTGSVNADRDVGGLVGWNDDAISNCYSTGWVDGNNEVGGLVGFNHPATAIISDCYATGFVTGGSQVGGLVGVNYYGALSNCCSTASVTGDSYGGGLAGINRGVITACYSTGLVRSLWGNYVGGLVGYNEGNIASCYSIGSAGAFHGDCVGGLVGENNATITACYSTGLVVNFLGDYGGGLVGNNYGSIDDSFWDVNTSGWTTSDGGTPKDTAEMKTQSTFTSAGWDFLYVWDICEVTNYPRFVWQIPSADWVCPDGVGLEDFGHFGGFWGTAEGGAVNLDDEDGIGFGDLMIFCEEWLSGR